MYFTKKKPSVVYWLPSEITERFNLYLNITNKCSNNCYFCFSRLKNGIGMFNLKLEKEPSSNEVIKELQEILGRRIWSEVVFCGFGEPLERLDCVLEVARWVKRSSENVVRVDTNGHGYLLNKEREVMRELKEAGIGKISVSLNAHDQTIYDQVCKPKFENTFNRVLEFAENAKNEDIDTEITAVTIPEVDISKVKEIAERMKVKFRVRQYIPCFW